MRIVRFFARLRRGATFAVLGVGLTMLALSLSQCQMVEERITGVSEVSLNSNSTLPSNCMRQCAKQFVESKALEIIKHQALVKACAGDPVCLALEDIRFEKALELLKAGQKACQAGCHHQGGGGGGR